jgi:hypothetical protein
MWVELMRQLIEVRNALDALTDAQADDPSSNWWHAEVTKEAAKLTAVIAGLMSEEHMSEEHAEKHTRLELLQYDRDNITELLKFAAKSRLIGRMYVGSIGEPVVRWTEDGSCEVIVPHTPGEMPR